MSDLRDKGMGWLRQPPDYRDFKYGPPSAVLAELPEQVDLRKEMPKIFDQGQLGSCAPNSAAACVQHAEIKARDPDRDRLSRLWIYWYARERIGTTQEDSGSFIRDCFKVAAERGVPRERYWPYNIDQFELEPTAGERSAPHHRVLEYRALDERSERDMQACVAEGYPFAFGFAVYSSFFDIREDGQWLGIPGRIEGYHAVVAVGYDFRSSAWAGGFWVVRNSWGTGFGAGGHFLVPRSFMAAEAWDCWTVRKVSRDPVNIQ